MTKADKIVSYIFLAMILLIISIFWVSLFKEPKKSSIVENRNLIQYPYFDLQSFLQGNFQQTLENAMGDQVLASGTIKLKYKTYHALVNNTQLKIIKRLHPNICYNYLAAGSGFFTYNCGDYLVNKPMDLQDLNSGLNLFYDNYNSFFDLDEMYFYFVTSSDTMDFDNPSKNDEYYQLFLDKFKNIDRLKIDSYDTFTNYFYKTDHHWNHRGSYQAYLDLLKLLKINEPFHKPVSEETFDVNFIGSAGRANLGFSSKEPFKVYKFDLPMHKTFVNGKETTYGNQENYFKGNYSREKYVGHYGAFYGWDYGEVIYDYNNDKKENLLIISSSFSNSINQLLASHFNKTYIIDLRYYFNVNNEYFSPDDYIKKHKISTVLFLANFGAYTSEEFWIKEDV